MKEYAKENGIAESTFGDWVMRYKQDRNNFITNVGKEEVITTSSLPAFIELTKDMTEEVAFQYSAPIKLTYKDVSLDCDTKELEKEDIWLYQNRLKDARFVFPQCDRTIRIDSRQLKLIIKSIQLINHKKV